MLTSQAIFVQKKKVFGYIGDLPTEFSAATDWENVDDGVGWGTG